MIKSIFVQLWNRRRSNLWTFFELLLVFCLIWYMVDYFFVLRYNHSIEDHRNIDHTWKLHLSEYKTTHPGYSDEAADQEVRRDNYRRVLQALKDYPAVEAVAISFWGSAPASTSQNTNTYMNAAADSVKIGAQDIYLDTQWDYFKVFRHTASGVPVSTRDFDWSDPRAVVIGKMVSEKLFGTVDAVGRTFTYHTGGGEQLVVGVVDDVKRFAYLRPRAVIYHTERIAKSFGDISIRVNSSIPDALFREQFLREMTPRLQIGNFYLREIVSYHDLTRAADASFGISNEIRLRLYLMAFFLISIMLCLVGTFWYRVNLRREEIFTRRALGSSRSGIRNLFVWEALALLLVVLPVAMLIEYQFVRAGLIETLGREINDFGVTWEAQVFLPDKTLLRFVITNGITLLIMAVATVIAVAPPARFARFSK